MLLFLCILSLRPPPPCGTALQGGFHFYKGVCMPYKPKHPCSYPGCPELTNNRYCDKHKKLTDAQYNKYGRSPEQKKRYGNNWSRIRNAYFKEHPYCEICKQNGKLTVGEQIHHIKPIAEGGSNEWSNLMTLCRSCHSRLHAERGDRWKRK